jgi:1,4-dihydroxy-2-naphthoate octaprenyltransferase
LSKNNISKFSTWISAARLRTLPLSMSGVFIGSFASCSTLDFNLFIFILTLATTISYQLLSNFANDYGDGVKGTDKNRIGPERALQSGIIGPQEMKKGIIISSVISLFLTILLVYLCFSKDFFSFVIFIGLGVLAIIAAIKYTVGENAYGYSGYGDFFVFVFFGLVSVLGSNYLFTSSLNFSLLSPACTVGLLAAGVLNLNNMRDLENDQLMGKKTLAVSLGTHFSRLYHYLLIALSIVLMSVFLFKLNSPLLMGLFAFIILLLIVHLIQISNIVDPKKFDKLLKSLVFVTVFYSLVLSLHYLEII